MRFRVRKKSCSWYCAVIARPLRDGQLWCKALTTREKPWPLEGCLKQPPFLVHSLEFDLSEIAEVKSGS